MIPFTKQPKMLLGIVAFLTLFVIAIFAGKLAPSTAQEEASPGQSVDTKLMQYNDRVENKTATMGIGAVPSPLRSNACVLDLVISPKSGSVAVGGEIAYVITVSNNGSVPCDDASLSLYYPSNERYQDASPAPASGYYWRFGTLAGGEQTTIALTALHQDDEEVSITLEGCVSASNADDACASAVTAIAGRSLPLPSAPRILQTIPPLVIDIDAKKIPQGGGREAGVWVWSFVEDMNKAQMESTVSATATNGFTVIYLTIDNYLDLFFQPVSADQQSAIDAYTASLESFISIASAHGIAVDAVAGWRDWAEPSKREKAFAILSYVSSFNSTHASKFRGVQYDVEPYLLPQYEGDKATVLGQFVELADQLERRAAASNLRLALVIPHFYDAAQAWTPPVAYQGATRYTFNHLLSFLGRHVGNSLIIMAYRNHADGDDGTIALAQKEITDANADGGKVKIIVAQEMGDVDPDYVTFARTSRAVLFGELARINAAFASQAAFGGLAVHYLDPFLVLR